MAKPTTQDSNSTIVIDNFQGRLSRYREGELNSGYAKYATTHGNNPFTTPGNLTWFEEVQQIDPTNQTIIDLIVAMRPRLENGITYVYAIGHLGRLYKIQVNDPTTYNPNYDHAVFLTTLAINSPTFKYGGSIQFFGATEKLYIGHDKGVTSINFDGSGEAFVGVVGTWTQNVPRPAADFVGSLFYGNGTNIAQIDSTATVSTYTRLTPAFPIGTQVRDIDVSPDGNYLQITVSRVPQADMTTTTQDTSSLSSGDSYLFQWPGSTDGYTAYTPFNSYSVNSNISFGEFGYTVGYDQDGAAIYSGSRKIVSLQNFHSPNYASMFSTGNMLGFSAPEAFAASQGGDQLFASLLEYGAYDEEIPTGLYRFFVLGATGGATDIIQVPACTIVSNLLYGSSTAGYTGSRVGSSKVYFSTFEIPSNPSTAWKLYKFLTVPTGLGKAYKGQYETQNQLFSKKVQVKEVRIYTEPLQTGVDFALNLIGSSGQLILNGDKEFAVGTNVDTDQDYLWWNPQIAPTYSLGLQIQNLGDTNFVINKIEVDYASGGK